MTEREELPANNADRNASHLDHVLQALGTAQPVDGLEQRILRRLATQSVRSPGSRWAAPALRAQLLGAGVCATLAVCTAAVLLPHGSHTRVASGATQTPVERARAARSMSADASSPARLTAHASATVSLGRPLSTSRQSMPAQATASVSATANCTSAPCHHGQSQRDQPSPIANTTGNAAQTQSFPAPPMPLTEQERLLLRIAHRNDPVQVAMLDPVERNLQLARERAESARFFAPPKLPPELQAQINAALRSQYVNTPPPRELLAIDQNNDRSTP